jgi:glycosyltransferase involved in cell wall biosynthesis
MLPAVKLSVVIITLNEEFNIGRTLVSVRFADELIVVDAGSSDRTQEFARAKGAQVFTENWKGFSEQKNSAIEKASGDWILSLDADEMVDAELAQEIQRVVNTPENGVPLPNGYWMARKNYIFGRWMKHGGYWPDRKLRLFRRGTGRVEPRPVHETVHVAGQTAMLRGALIHHTYPTVTEYINSMNRYSSLGAEVAYNHRARGFSLWNIMVRPTATFIYNYVLRLGFLDGREGLLLHLYHSMYVSLKYAKAWELGKLGVDRP